MFSCYSIPTVENESAISDSLVSRMKSSDFWIARCDCISFRPSVPNQQYTWYAGRGIYNEAPPADPGIHQTSGHTEPAYIHHHIKMRTSILLTSILAVAVAAAPPSPAPIKFTCTKGTPQCCASVQSASSPPISILLGLLGIIVSSPTEKVGSNCKLHPSIHPSIYPSIHLLL